MLRPTPEQIAEIKTASRVKFGHDRVLGIPLGAPIDAYFAVAAFASVREYAAHMDASMAGEIQARSALVADRCLWPSQKEIAEVRAEWPALDAKLENEALFAAGYTGEEVAHVALFSAATAPPGFAAAADLAAKVQALHAAHPGVKLWSITSRANGLALVMSDPSESVYTAFQHMINESQRSPQKAVLTLTGAADFTRDLVVWSPRPFDAHLDEKPGRAAALLTAWPEMGGATAASSSSFL